MTVPTTRSLLLTSVALAALVGLTAIPGTSVWVVASATGQVELTPANQNTALEAIARANNSPDASRRNKGTRSDRAGRVCTAQSGRNSP